MTRWRWLGMTALMALATTSGPAPAPVAATPASSTLTRLPLRFEANAGQWDSRVRFVARGNGTTLGVTDDGMTLAATSARSPVHIALVNAHPSEPRGLDPLVTKTNYFLGNDPSRWRTNVPSYGSVRASGWAPGVDVVFHGGPDGLEYDLELQPGPAVGDDCGGWQKPAVGVRGGDAND